MFCGSGTTIIAAETADRICYAMEIDPGYCDVTIARFEAMTGQPAILDGEDHTFADVTAARAINRS
jgi:DNA modification methylase